MQIPRIYTPQALAVNQRVTLDPAATNHLINVLRLPLGGRITLFNNTGGEYHGTLSDKTKREVTVQLESFDTIDRLSEKSLVLAQGISKGDRMDWVVQKSTELGVTTIVPLITTRCVLKLDEKRWQKKWQHWQKVAIHACEQSGRNRLPEIMFPLTFNAWLADLAEPNDVEVRCVLSHRAQQGLPKINHQTQQVTTLIGPEGGLTAEEISKAETKHFQATCLGPRVLRTETAAVAMLALVQFYNQPTGI